MDRNGSENLTEIEMIEQGLDWLQKNMSYRDDTNGGASSRAVKYSNNLCRVITRIKRVYGDDKAFMKFIAEMQDKHQLYESLVGLLLDKGLERHDERMEKIKEGIIKIKAAHIWAVRNEQNRKADYQIVLDRLERVYNELYRLGVSKEFSASLFVFGPAVTVSLIKQFKEEK